jgi:hypothetical protein
VNKQAAVKDLTTQLIIGAFEREVALVDDAGCHVKAQRRSS